MTIIHFTSTPGRPKRFCLIFALFLFFSASTFGELYIWVDENGRTHYSDRKPKDMKGVRVEEMTPSDSAATENNNQNSNQQNNEQGDPSQLSEAEAYQVRQQTLLEALKEERELQKNAKFKQEQDKRNVAKYCSQLRDQIIANSNDELNQVNDENGREQLTEEEHEAHKNRLRELYEQNCESIVGAINETKE